MADGEILVVDAPVASGRSLDSLVSLVQAAGLRPAALFLAGFEGTARMEPVGELLPILVSARTAGQLSEALGRHLRDEVAELARLAAELRLAAAEAALADPQPAAAAGSVGGRIQRGVAVTVDGELRSLQPRLAGRALAARFAATHARLLSGAGARAESTRRTRDGLWLIERRIRPGAALWLFDDLPFARIDEVAADALVMTLRAVLRRPAGLRPALARPAATQPPSLKQPAAAAGAPKPDADDRIRQTLLAVARANGRVAPAARALGVHRNTVLYRLRQATAQGSPDPRRAEDALRILTGEARRSG